MVLTRVLEERVDQMLQKRAQVNAVATPVVAVGPQERRRHQRVKVALPGRFMLEDRREFPCRTINISPGGVAIETYVRGAPGEKIIAYLNQIGRVEGILVRHFDNGFAVKLTMPAVKREKLADQLTWLANRQDLGMAEDRRHERLPPRLPRTTLKAPGGREYAARLIDVSISGAAMTVEVSPPIGAPVVVGETAALVVRHFSGGIAVEFNRLIPADQFDDGVKL